LSLLAAHAGTGVTRTLSGHVPAVTRSLPSTGVLPAEQVLHLAIGLTPRDEAGMSQLLDGLYDPASPLYRHYLTPAEFAERFAATAADYEAVARFAAAGGLQVTKRHDNRLVIDVAGTVSQIQRTFQITLRTYAHPVEAREFFAPDREPTVAAVLSVADVSGLDNYVTPRPRLVRRDAGQGGGSVPLTGTGSGPSGEFRGKDFRAAYMPNTTLTGAGQVVGLYELDGFYASDITSYENSAGLAHVPVQAVLVDGFSGTPTTGANSGNTEVSLDIEMAIAMAPGLAQILVFEGTPSSSQNDVLNAMAAHTEVRQFSCSWGWGGGPTTTTDNIFKLMALQGQSFFTASGDGDAFTVGASSVNGADNPNLANAPSSCPYITAVGGTTLTTASAGGPWSSETVWNWGLTSGSYVGSSGGVSSHYPIPAWQAGTSMLNNGGSSAWRNTPDVAATADNIYVTYGNGSSTMVGGTSAAAPLWAGVAALINQKAAAGGLGPIGFINPALYALGNSNLYSSTFHDISTGNNFWSSSPGDYQAVAGYDLCTGWGTPAGQALINALAGTGDPLFLSPVVGFASGGVVGGPFSVTTQSITLTNTGTIAIPWSLVNTSSWLTVSTSSGVLPVGGSATVVISLAASTTNLAANTYTSVMVLSNANTHLAQGGQFTLRTSLPNLLTNGGFETGDFTGWTLVGNTVTYGSNPTIYNAVESSASGYPLVVHSGTYGAFLGDDHLATLSQTFPTTPGQLYLLSLWFNNPSTGSGQQFEVRWITNGVVDTLYNNASPAAFTWTNMLFFVTAGGTSTTLQFGVENLPNYFGLDDVFVNPVPPIDLQTPVVSGDNVTFTWASLAGVRYQVQYTTSISPTGWTNLGGATAAVGHTTSYTDTSGLTNFTERFYRVIATP